MHHERSEPPPVEGAHYVTHPKALVPTAPPAPGAAAEARDRPQPLTISTGMCACVSTFCATLPRMSALTP